MFLSYITLAVALSLSVIAAYYSIAGLAAIFAAAVVPIMIMGSILELGKVVVTLWLHEYWRQCRFLMKAYLVPAVAALMLITSMGIFGFLSKAHSDQSLVSGDVQSKISVYDEKIKTAKDNIDANRKALKQMDEAVDQVMGRSSDEKGADKAVAIRRAQQKERARLQAEIAAEQKTVSQLSEERAPIAAEVRKVEAEVGPIKYIAALIYGDNTDANVLEKAVTWVIILLVVVFDPLAIMMLLAATESLKWERAQKEEREFETRLQQSRKVAQALDAGDPLPPQDTVIVEEPEPEKSLLERHPYLMAGFEHFKGLKPMVYKPEVPPVEEPEPEELDEDHLELEEDSPELKAAKARWKLENPESTLKSQRHKLAKGEIDELPWMVYMRDEPKFGFGNEFPATPAKGDSWMKTDRVPNTLHKFNGDEWIAVDKVRTDNYTYDMAYIDHLISKLSTGEYDPELLSESEQAQVAQRLESKENT